MEGPREPKQEGGKGNPTFQGSQDLLTKPACFQGSVGVHDTLTRIFAAELALMKTMSFEETCAQNSGWLLSGPWIAHGRRSFGRHWLNGSLPLMVWATQPRKAMLDDVACLDLWSSLGWLFEEVVDVGKKGFVFLDAVIVSAGCGALSYVAGLEYAQEGERSPESNLFSSAES